MNAYNKKMGYKAPFNKMIVTSKISGMSIMTTIKYTADFTEK